MVRSSEARRDWVDDRRKFLLAWGVPIIALVLGGLLDLEAIVFPAALAWMGSACLANASRCGRLHCYFTGPFFLVMALASLAHGLALAPLGPTGWDWIVGITLVGGVALTFGPEMIWGRYAQRRHVR